MSLGTVLAIANKVVGAARNVVSTPNFVPSNNAFVRSEQAKNVSYRYGR